ncbi:Purine permease [Saitozyma sp. JCM 24511]|nr:Purine permease [Saitozyma sp. JCM 24511]
MSSIATSPPPQSPMEIPKDPFVRRVTKKLTTKEGWFGSYNFGFLCLPQFPYGKNRVARVPPPFYSLHADLPILLAIVCGFQHSLAMLAGVITPPIIFASELNLSADYQSYMISASLISSGILSMVQMSRIRLWRNYYLGTGLITVVGTSFASLSTASAIFNALYADGTCPSTTAADGTVTRGACPDAFGALIGTTLVCSFLEMAMSFVPPAKLRRVFPPLVTGLTVVLIGASLIGDSGFLNWGGGSNGCQERPELPSIFHLCPTIFAKKPLAFGSPQFLGLGFLSFVTIILVEIFGSPFMRNASIIIGLIVGMIVAGATGYVDSSNITSAPAITFLWVKRFKLRVYGPAVLPGLAVYIALAMEAIGDITASSEVSRVEVDGPEFDSRIQGGVLADGIAGFLSGLFTVTPMSIFAQNNGVIALTRCANRKAGYVCASFLILYGVLGKISGVFLSIPNPVLGGVTTFLFASVFASGVKVLSYIKWTRKERFILAASASFGLGNLLVPTWATYLFADVNNPSTALSGFFNSIVIILSTPYLIAGIVAVILNLIIPDDAPERDDVVHSTSPAPGYVDSQPGLPMLGKSTDVEKTAGMEDEDYKARVEPSEGVSGVSSGVQARTTVLEA